MLNVMSNPKVLAIWRDFREAVSSDRDNPNLKKLSSSQKIKLLRLNARRARRRLRRPSVAFNVGKTAQAKALFHAERSRLPTIVIDNYRYDGYFAFTPPENLSFSENYEETLAFILDFKRLFAERRSHRCSDGVMRKAYADFAAMERIGAGAGLVLAAEVHRYSQYLGKPPTVHDHLWAEEVRSYFLEAGLFDLLKIDPEEISVKQSPDPQRQTLKFRSGRTSQGRDARALIQEMQALAGHSMGPNPTVYAAIAEALANVSHAYPEWFRTWPYRPSRRWWASGFWAPTSKTVGLQLYDQGAGIPATLPKQTHWPKLLKAIDPEGTPAGLISAALQYGRTSTGQAGRGKGLAEMANWIETTNSGFLRIMSGGGEITYRPGAQISRRNFNAPFCGTLIQWEVNVGN
ncbi:hypothetical protein [Sphingomonas sp.]|uniref:hypothetical protein n=1 Tax=Sphingomonas sp. TaxID=28214 RepID=UPI003BABFEDE